MVNKRLTPLESRESPKSKLAHFLHAEAEDFDPAGLRIANLGRRGHRLLRLRPASLGLFVASRDDHRPIGATGCGAFYARDTDPRRTMHQEIPAMPARLNPLIEGFGEAVVAIGDILGGSPGP